MGLITRLKSLIGLGDERSKTRPRDDGVTIEREPSETRAQPNVETEKAVKTADESPDEDTSVSTDELVDEGEPADHIEEAEPNAAAEPAEATGPSSEAGQPAGTEATEPEPDAAEAEEETDVTESETDVTDAETTASDDESIEEGRPLEDVKGIGPAYAERLRNAGVENSAQLADADAAELARETDLSTTRIEGWMERARSM